MKNKTGLKKFISESHKMLFFSFFPPRTNLLSATKVKEMGVFRCIQPKHFNADEQKVVTQDESEQNFICILQGTAKNSTPRCDIIAALTSAVINPKHSLVIADKRPHQEK